MLDKFGLTRFFLEKDLLNKYQHHHHGHQFNFFYNAFQLFLFPAFDIYVHEHFAEQTDRKQNEIIYTIFCGICSKFKKKKKSKKGSMRQKWAATHLFKLFTKGTTILNRNHCLSRGTRELYEPPKKRQPKNQQFFKKLQTCLFILHMQLTTYQRYTRWRKSHQPIERCLNFCIWRYTSVLF